MRLTMLVRVSPALCEQLRLLAHLLLLLLFEDLQASRQILGYQLAITAHPS